MPRLTGIVIDGERAYQISLQERGFSEYDEIFNPPEIHRMLKREYLARLTRRIEFLFNFRTCMHLVREKLGQTAVENTNAHLSSHRAHLIESLSCQVVQRGVKWEHRIILYATKDCKINVFHVVQKEKRNLLTANCSYILSRQLMSHNCLKIITI